MNPTPDLSNSLDSNDSSLDLETLFSHPSGLEVARVIVKGIICSELRNSYLQPDDSAQSNKAKTYSRASKLLDALNPEMPSTLNDVFAGREPAVAAKSSVLEFRTAMEEAQNGSHEASDHSHVKITSPPASNSKSLPSQLQFSADQLISNSPSSNTLASQSQSYQTQQFQSSQFQTHDPQIQASRGQPSQLQYSSSSRSMSTALPSGSQACQGQASQLQYSAQQAATFASHTLASQIQSPAHQPAVSSFRARLGRPLPLTTPPSLSPTPSSESPTPRLQSNIFQHKLPTPIQTEASNTQKPLPSLAPDVSQDNRSPRERYLATLADNSFQLQRTAQIEGLGVRKPLPTGSSNMSHDSQHRAPHSNHSYHLQNLTSFNALNMSNDGQRRAVDTRLNHSAFPGQSVQHQSTAQFANSFVNASTPRAAQDRFTQGDRSMNGQQAFAKPNPTILSLTTNPNRSLTTFAHPNPTILSSTIHNLNPSMLSSATHNRNPNRTLTPLTLSHGLSWSYTNTQEANFSTANISTAIASSIKKNTKRNIDSLVESVAKRARINKEMKPAKALKLRTKKKDAKYTPALDPHIWMNIFEFTQPSTLPKFRLVSKQFKSLIDEYDSIYTNCLKHNYGDDMPDPPKGLTVRQYMDLLGGKGCMAPGCDDKLASRTHWSWAQRWCMTCWKSKIKRDDYIIKERSLQVGRADLDKMLESIPYGMHDSFVKPHDIMDIDPRAGRNTPRLYKYFLTEDVDRIIKEFDALTPAPYVEDPNHSADEKATALADHQRLVDSLEARRTEFFAAKKAIIDELMSNVRRIEAAIRVKREKDGGKYNECRASRRELFSTRAMQQLEHIPFDFIERCKPYKAAVRIFRDGGSERGWRTLKPKIELAWEEYQKTKEGDGKASVMSIAAIT